MLSWFRFKFFVGIGIYLKLEFASLQECRDRHSVKN